MQDNSSIVFNKQSFLQWVYMFSCGIVTIYLLSSWVYEVMDLRKNLMLGYIMLLVIGFVLVRRQARIIFTAQYYVALTYLLITINSVYAGGIISPGIIWYLMCLLVSFLTLSFRASVFWLWIVLGTLLSFYFFEHWIVVRHFNPGRHWNLMANLLMFIAVYFILRAFRLKVTSRTQELIRVNQLLEQKQSQLKASEAELKLQRDYLEMTRTAAIERSKKISYYLNQHLEISRMEELHTGSFQYAIQAVQRFVVRAMELDAMAIWYAHPDGNLKLIGSSGRHSRNNYEVHFLEKSEFPEALDLLESGAMIVGPGRHLAARQLMTGLKYHKTEDTAVIACPFFISGKFAGFFICRAVEKNWTDEDMIFVRAISDTISLAFKSHERKNHHRLLQEKQQQVEEANSMLEEKVKERTLALNTVNGKLTELAFTNAHILRGPICRLLGLQNLLKVTDDISEKEELIRYVSNSIDELDEITRNFSKELSSISRR